MKLLQFPCNGYKPVDLNDVCVRSWWSAVIPVVFVFFLCFISIPIPKFLQKATGLVKKPFRTYITIQEAEALDASQSHAAGTVDKHIPLWRTITLSWTALLQALIWLGVGVFHFTRSDDSLWSGIQPTLVALSWAYASFRPILRPSATPPFGLLVLYIIHLVAAALLLGGHVYDNYAYGTPFPSSITLGALVINLVSILGLIGVVMAMPLAIPSDRVKEGEIGKSVSPEDYTSLWGWISFLWIYPLVSKGNSSTLNEKDVWNLSAIMQSRPIFFKFSNIKGVTLFRRIWLSNSLDILLDITLTTSSVVLQFLGPFFLKRILDLISSRGIYSPDIRAQAYLYAFLTFLRTLLKSQVDLHRLWFNRRAATRVRSELMAAVYDKSLKRKDLSGSINKTQSESDNDKGVKDKGTKKTEGAAPAGADVGKIVNLMSGDAKEFTEMMQGINFVYAAPFEIAFSVSFLYNILGTAAFAGLASLLIAWPINHFISKRSIKIYQKLSAARDKRMSLVNETVGAVKFIKFFAWEDRWIQRVLAARETELGLLIKSFINSIFFSFVWSVIPVMICTVAFLVFVIQGNQLTVPIAFTAISLFQLLSTPLNALPMYIVLVLQSLVALKRIESYLEEDEVNEQVSSLKGQSDTGNLDVGEGLGIEKGSFEWNRSVKDKDVAKSQDAPPAFTNDDTATLAGSESPNEGRRFELKDISVRFPLGKLSIITGPTASGKTAMLLALLGEMTQTEGRLIMSKDPSKVDENGLMHSISYAAQQPWLQHASIKDNILFGYPYDEERYSEVIECCALGPDLALLDDGDLTEIGARGVSLSGGQKARVALARAVYARTKFVLLDDPLSAVDSHTSRFLFDKLLRGPLLEHRTVILVTHHVQLVLPGAYYLLQMEDGHIKHQGTVKDLRTQGILSDIAYEAEPTAGKSEESSTGVPADPPALVTHPSTDILKKPAKLVQDEFRDVGGVKLSIYNTYLKASSYWTWIFVILFIITFEISNVSSKFWMKVWGESYSTSGLFLAYSPSLYEGLNVLPHYPKVNAFLSTSLNSVNSLPSADNHPMFYVGIYAAIALAMAVTNILKMVTLYVGSIKASRSLFKNLLITVVSATFRWHDTTPQGRMLNRFGNDMRTIDGGLSGSLERVNSALATFIIAVLTVTYIFPLFLIPATLLAFAYRWLATAYINTARDLRRMESNSRSPIFSGFSELLEGIVTVRAFSAEKRFLDDIHSKIDITTSAWYHTWMSNRWLMLNFDWLGAVSVLIATTFALSGLVSVGLAAICITSAMSFDISIYWACRFWTQLELDLNSVERLVEYLDLPQEPPAIIQSNRPPAYWPSSSNKDTLISVENLTIKYSPELPAVVHGVSFTLKGRERVGLLGRTGSGKSTIAMSILRFVEPAGGRIVIDGIDISTIGTHDLRSRLTFIPQDATLFSGTLRDNLDPFGEHEDSECLDVLYRVHLLSRSTNPSTENSERPSRVPSVSGLQREETAVSLSSTLVDNDANKVTLGLDTQISAGGTNVSLGQRQLIAMARALLRRSSIIVMDEATSSIDFATDTKIQATIREEFNDALLLTVAHRLSTIIDYDRLIVLDKGEIVEFDTPYNLIRKEDGVFRNMCLQSGSFVQLESAAKAKAEG